MTHLIREAPERIGAEGIDQVHRHHDQRHQRQRHAALLGTQHQKGFAEAGQGKQSADEYYPAIGFTQLAQVVAPQGVAALVAIARFGFTQTDGEQGDRGQPGNDRQPEDGAKIIVPEQHQSDGQQWPQQGADRVEGLAQAEGRAAQLRRSEVGHQRIAGGAPNAFADSVQQAGGQYQPTAGGDGKQRLGQGSQPVAQQGQPLAASQIVAQGAGEDLDHQGRRLCHPFDEADGEGTAAKHGHHEEG